MNATAAILSMRPPLWFGETPRKTNTDIKAEPDAACACTHSHFHRITHKYTHTHTRKHTPSHTLSQTHLTAAQSW